MSSRSATAPGSSLRIQIDERTQIGAARRSAVALGHTHGLGVDAIGRLAIVVTEAATNVLLHGGGGSILLRGMAASPVRSIEVLALDKGVGIPDVARAMQDGFSTSGTAGQGLGAIKRLAQVFGIYSQRDQGTVILARVGESAPRTGPASVDERLGVVCVPLRGEIACGDAWQVIAKHDGIAVLLVDGLGHGPDAATAAAVATAMFPKLAVTAPDTALVNLNKAMRGTRGAALSVATMDDNTRTLQFAGVGNVDGRVLCAGPAEHLVPQNGIVGHTMPVVRSVSAAWPAGACLVMHSDGISSRWRPDAYPGLMNRHPALLAAVIYRDFARERDDATILVLRNGTEEAA